MICKAGSTLSPNQWFILTIPDCLQYFPFVTLQIQHEDFSLSLYAMHPRPNKRNFRSGLRTKALFTFDRQGSPACVIRFFQMCDTSALEKIVLNNIFSRYRICWTNSSKKCNFKNIWNKVNLSYQLLARVLAFLRITYANEYSTCTRRKASLLVCGARVVNVCVCVCARLRLGKLFATTTTTKEWHGKIITVC